MMARVSSLIALLLLMTLPVFAQADSPRVEDVNYDVVVTDSISETAVFDWWQFDAEAGDVVVATMEASAGLAPFIGLRSPGGDIIHTSPSTAATPPKALAYSWAIRIFTLLLLALKRG